MPEEYLQAAFEIKASCDEISRRILRWHWENKPGAHSLDALLEHLARRQQESPAYYGHLPDIGRKTSWQQLDTTLCMRILLDPENDAAQPLDLLGSAAHPGAARRACNAIRTARNEAAHAADRAAGGQAAILFDEAVECLEDGYAGTAFSERDLSKYYGLAQDYLRRCGVGSRPADEPAADAPELEVNVYPTGAARQKAAAARSREAGAAAKTAQPRAKGQAGRKGQSGRAAGGTARKGQGSTGRGSQSRAGAKGKRPKKQENSRGVWLAAAAALLIGLAVRAMSMGLWPFG